jgi:hypothetical protein
MQEHLILLNLPAVVPELVLVLALEVHQPARAVDVVDDHVGDFEAGQRGESGELFYARVVEVGGGG